MPRKIFIVYTIPKGDYEQHLPEFKSAFFDEEQAIGYRDALLEKDPGVSLSYEDLGFDELANRYKPEWIEFWDNFVGGRPTTPTPEDDICHVPEWDRYFRANATLHIGSTFVY